MRKRGDVWTEAKALREMSTLGISKSEAARRLGRHSSTISVRSRRADLRWTSQPKQIRKAKPPPLGPIARPWTKFERDRQTDRYTLRLTGATRWERGG
jgi:transposase